MGVRIETRRAVGRPRRGGCSRESYVFGASGGWFVALGCPIPDPDEQREIVQPRPGWDAEVDVLGGTELAGARSARRIVGERDEASNRAAMLRR